LRAPPAKLHQDPRFPPPHICPLRSISPSFPALTPMPATRSSYSISPPLASLPDPPSTSSQVTHSHFLLLSCIPASLRSFCKSCHSRCHRSSVVSQPSQTPPCPTPSPPERPGPALAPAPSWPFARPPPKRGGSRRCSTSSPMWTQARAPRPHRTCLCEIPRGIGTATSRYPPMRPRNKCALVRAGAHVFFTHMATTTDPLVGFRCSFVLWASGSGLQGQIREAKACHERNMARRATARSESKQQASSNKTNLTKRKRNSCVLRAYLCPSRPMECSWVQGWYVEQL
jgi:hypothetical protein